MQRIVVTKALHQYDLYNLFTSENHKFCHMFGTLSLPHQGWSIKKDRLNEINKHGECGGRTVDELRGRKPVVRSNSI